MIESVRPQFELAKGVHVPDLSGVSEGFSCSKGEKFDRLMINITRSRLRETVFALVRQIAVPGFLVIEMPCHRDVEMELRSKPSDPLHKDVFYLDGIDHPVFEGIIDDHAEFFFDDGMLRFGFGSHAGVDEVMVGRYKLTTVLGVDGAKYVNVLAGLGYEQRNPLRTVFQTFTKQTPGNAERIKVGNDTIYEMVEALKKRGLRFAERREDR